MRKELVGNAAAALLDKFARSKSAIYHY
jgi:hypothetical protein